jgi:hypothetical protein
MKCPICRLGLTHRRETGSKGVVLICFVPQEGFVLLIGFALKGLVHDRFSPNRFCPDRFRGGGFSSQYVLPVKL